jgi:predicted nucleotidyltransferase
MNTEKDFMIRSRVFDHLNEAERIFGSDGRIVGIFLQGSQNYGLDTEKSDVDTKLIVVPLFKDIALNRKPVSTTHVRENEEHIDFKDIRLYIETFRKQNLNFLEILFTDYKYVNMLYMEEWGRLEHYRERIARMNPYRAVKSMKGVALEKYHAMEHEYPSKVEVLAQYGYDPKQLHHLLRVKEYLERYIVGEFYESCLKPHDPEYLKEVKLGKYSLEEARRLADDTIEKVVDRADWFCARIEDTEDEEMRELLEDVSYNIMKIAVENELKG